MVTSRKVIKIFLASPGDLATERKLAKAAVDETNSTWANSFGYHVELVGWEDTVSSFGRPQAIINKDIEDCDYFIGLMWRRWGTAPSKEGPHSSGFEEEFELALSRRRDGGRPEISLFFRDIDADLLVDPGDDLKKVLQFKERLETEKIVLFERFGEPTELPSKIRRSVSAYIRQLMRSEGVEAARAGQTAYEGSSKSTEPTTSYFPKEGAIFIQRVLGEREPQIKKITSLEVARFRLLGNINPLPGNDEGQLGVHDANLLFLHRATLELSDEEISHLFDCGLGHLDSEAVPTWHWYSSFDGFARNLLPYRSRFGPSDVQTGALRAMAMFQTAIPNDNLKRDQLIGTWLASQPTKVAALEYLAECGNTDDVEQIKAELERADYQTRGAAINALVAISLRSGIDSLLATLLQLQPETVDRSTVAFLREHISDIDKTALVELTSHKSAAVRQASLTELVAKNEIDRALLETLLKDSDDEVRFTAILALTSRGRSFSEDEAKQILSSPSKGLGMLFGGSERTPTKWFERFRDRQLRALSDEQLTAMLLKDAIINFRPYIIRSEKFFAKYAEELRANVGDKFESYFQHGLSEFSTALGSDHKLVSDIKGLGDHLREQMLGAALAVLCRRALTEDLSLIRATLRSNNLTFHEDYVQYLSQHGTIGDVPTIIRLALNPPAESKTLLAIPDSTDCFTNAAKAALSLANNDFRKLLAMDAPIDFRIAVLAVLPKSHFKKIDQASLLSVLSDANIRLRKVAVLQTIRALSKRKIEAVLREYTSRSEQYFYNVTYWLDLGLSAPKQLIDRVTQKELAKFHP